MALKNTNGRILMSYCPDIRILDCTLRDGGLVNNFAFPDEFVKALYQANIASGVDYMEFGYKASKRLFSTEEFGEWKFCDEASIRRIVGENDSPMKISVMADVGRCDYQTDILPKSESVIDLVRVATYIHQIPTAIRMIADAKEKGYEVSVNIMAVSKVGELELQSGIEMLAQSGVDYLYLVDSYGAFYPEQVKTLTELYMEIGEKYGITVGYHGHNNQQLAFANTIESLRYGASLLDGTVCGMGRGAGNCFLESLLGFLKNPKYDIMPVLKFIETHMGEMKQKYEWGFDVSYMLTGIPNAHPKSAIAFQKGQRQDYTRFYQEMLEGE